MTTLYAQPYSLDATGFYFEAHEEFEEKAAKNRDSFGMPVEEYEIQFIDGDNSELFSAAGIDQTNLETWFDQLSELEGDEVSALIYLTDVVGVPLSEALESYDDVCIHHGTAEDYAYDLINETTEIPESLRAYIGYQAIAHDMEINGEIYEISHDVIVTNCLDF